MSIKKILFFLIPTLAYANPPQDKLIQFLESNNIISTDQFLEKIPLQYLFAAIPVFHTENKKQHASIASPRIIHRNREATALFSVTSTHHVEGGQTLETILWNPKRLEWEFVSFDFNLRKQGKPWIEQNPASCSTANCHRGKVSYENTPLGKRRILIGASPNMEPYPHWFGMMGSEELLSRESRLKHLKEYDILKEWKASSQGRERFKHFPSLGELLSGNDFAKMYDQFALNNREFLFALMEIQKDKIKQILLKALLEDPSLIVKYMQTYAFVENPDANPEMINPEKPFFSREEHARWKQNQRQSYGILDAKQNEITGQGFQRNLKNNSRALATEYLALKSILPEPYKSQFESVADFSRVGAPPHLGNGEKVEFIFYRVLSEILETIEMPKTDWGNSPFRHAAMLSTTNDSWAARSRVESIREVFKGLNIKEKISQYLNVHACSLDERETVSQYSSF